MSVDFHEEEQLGKAFDYRTMKRLLGYVRPYLGLIILSTIMMIVATVANLARPYLIEVAIDQHMLAATEPMAVFPSGQAPNGSASVVFAGNEYVRIGSLPSNMKVTTTSLPEAQLLQANGNWYLVHGTGQTLPLPAHVHVAATADHNTTVIGRNGQPLAAQHLSKTAIQAFRSQDGVGIFRLGLLYLATIIIAFALDYIQTYVIGYAVQRIINDLREQLFTHLQRLSLAFFDSHPAGRLVTRVMNDCQTINDMFANLLLSFFKDIFTLIGIVVVLLEMNVQLAMISFVAIPLVIIATAIYRHYARNAFRVVRVKLARINASLAEYISGMRIIHMFQQQEQIYNKFHATNVDYLQSSMRELLTFAIFRPSMNFIYYFALALVLWYGGLHVLSGTIQFGVLYAFINYVQQFFQPIDDLSEKYNLVQQAMASSERIFELLDNQQFIPERAQPATTPPARGRVEFRNVWFAYVDEDWVLKDVSFTIEQGQTVAFVGATGAGKSSVLSLISRFYDVSKGEILVDGIDVKDWALSDLRHRVGIVLQDVFLFSGSIADNVRLGESSIDDDRVHEVIEHVNAAPFIDKLPGGIHYHVQERGSTFSAGQRQLIAFARALAFNPQILVLDEATANIDTETEQWIQNALEKVTQNRTTIVVAHRLSTIQHADNIVVLHKGRIHESGNHQELLAKQGLYWNLYQLQYQNQPVRSS
jgi:ATP-binding cassette subfamily B multidrug efflux pump